jgi:GPH family glycoside/pentoside/hexuronide:cation symporter
MAQNLAVNSSGCGFCLKTYEIDDDYTPIPLFEKIAYGVGVLPMNTAVGSIKNLAGPIFNITLGMHPFRVGNVLLAARFWDAFTDPVMGWISDNW